MIHSQLQSQQQPCTSTNNICISAQAFTKSRHTCNAMHVHSYSIPRVRGLTCAQLPNASTASRQARLAPDGPDVVWNTADVDFICPAAGRCISRLVKLSRAPPQRRHNASSSQSLPPSPRPASDASFTHLERVRFYCRGACVGCAGADNSQLPVWSWRQLTGAAATAPRAMACGSRLSVAASIRAAPDRASRGLYPSRCELRRWSGRARAVRRRPHGERGPAIADISAQRGRASPSGSVPA
eukprot:350228-Chlamydomonas_euryale.AAC.3